MTTFLADGNVLIALVGTDHVHHGEVTRWFVEQESMLVLNGLLGHRQITDAYLVTLDRGVTALHADVELLVP